VHDNSGTCTSQLIAIVRLKARVCACKYERRTATSWNRVEADGIGSRCRQHYPQVARSRRSSCDHAARTYHPLRRCYSTLVVYWPWTCRKLPTNDRRLCSRKCSNRTGRNRKAFELHHRSSSTPVALACAVWLTDLLTRRCGTAETARDVGDSHCPGSPDQRDGPGHRRRGRRASYGS